MVVRNDLMSQWKITREEPGSIDSRVVDWKSTAKFSCDGEDVVEEDFRRVAHSRTDNDDEPMWCLPCVTALARRALPCVSVLARRRLSLMSRGSEIVPVAHRVRAGRDKTRGLKSQILTHFCFFFKHFGYHTRKSKIEKKQIKTSASAGTLEKQFGGC